MCVSDALPYTVYYFTGANGQLFRDSPHNATSLLSSSIALTCSVPDDPPATIAWQHSNGTTIMPSERLTITYNLSTGISHLVIADLKYYDNGAYQCVVGTTTSDIGYLTTVG